MVTVDELTKSIDEVEMCNTTIGRKKTAAAKKI